MADAATMLDTVIGLDMRGDDARAAVRQVRLRGIEEGEYTWSLLPGGLLTTH